MKSQKSDAKEDMPEMPLPQNGNRLEGNHLFDSSDGEEEKDSFTDSDPETDQAN